MYAAIRPVIDHVARPALLLCLVSALAGLSGCQEIVDLKAQQTELAGRLDETATQTAALRRDSEEHQRRITEAVITVCDEQLALKQAVEGLRAATRDQGHTRSQIDDLGQRVDTLRPRLDALAKRLTEIDGQIAALRKQVAGLAQSQTKAGKAVEEARKADRERLGQLAAAVETLGPLGDRVGGLEAGREAEQQGLTQLREALARVETQVAGLHQALEALKKQRARTPKPKPAPEPESAGQQADPNTP